MAEFDLLIQLVVALFFDLFFIVCSLVLSGMVTIRVFFSGTSTGSGTGDELRGMAKRFTALGFQPVYGDEFEFNDLPEKDRAVLREHTREEKPGTLHVVKRSIQFEDTGFILQIFLQKK